MDNKEFLNTIISEGEEIKKEVRRVFEPLSEEELNRKPSPDSWSAGQCLEHLIVSNSHYFPILKDIIDGKRKGRFWEKMPLVPNLFGKLLTKAVNPNTKRKVKTFKLFNPSVNNLKKNIIQEFITHQDNLLQLMKKTITVDLDKYIITSPVSGLVTYSLKDCFNILILHEKRHIEQAKRAVG